MNYKNRIKYTQTFNGTTEELLRFSIDNEDKNKTGCIGWDYLKENLTEELKNILINEGYLKIVYNSENKSFIIKELNLKLNDELLNQLGSLIYIWKDIKRELDEEEKEKKLKNELLKRGFKEVEFLKYEKNENTEEFEKRCSDYYSHLNGLKVICVFDRDRIGCMGSYTNKEEKEGSLVYKENGLYFLPKRHTKTGQLLRSKFYYIEVLK